MQSDAEKIRRKTLAEMIRRHLAERNWSLKEAADNAKTMGIVGLSERNIREYLSGGRKRLSATKVADFARLFGANQRDWLSRFSGDDDGPLLFDRDAITEEQKKLEEGDSVYVLSARPFLEASDRAFRNIVLENLARGVTYTYYFPCLKSAGPFDKAAGQSYLEFREKYAANYDNFEWPPRLFGYPVLPDKFRYFSDLHTIVRYESNRERTRTYGYIELSRRGSVIPEKGWYGVPEDIWRQIDENLRLARSPIADFELPFFALNPKIRAIAADYSRWFRDPDLAELYNGLRLALGHEMDECVKRIARHINGVAFPSRDLRYLDIGCGDGAITMEIAKCLKSRGEVTAYGVDASERQIEFAKINFMAAPEFKFDGRVLNFKGSVLGETLFDLVTAIHSAYTIDESYLRRIFELLAPGGSACIWLATRTDNVIMQLSDALDEMLRPGQKRNSAEDVLAYAKGAGLEPAYQVFRRDVKCPFLSSRGELTEKGRELVGFCALRDGDLPKEALGLAVELLKRTRTDEGMQPIQNGLIIFRRTP